MILPALQIVDWDEMAALLQQEEEKEGLNAFQAHRVKKHMTVLSILRPLFEGSSFSIIMHHRRTSTYTEGWDIRHKKLLFVRRWLGDSIVVQINEMLTVSWFLTEEEKALLLTARLQLVGSGCANYP